MTIFADHKIEGVVKHIDKKSGYATVTYNGAGSVELFLPAYFGGQAAPYPKEGAALHMRIVEPTVGAPRVLDAWADK